MQVMTWDVSDVKTIQKKRSKNDSGPMSREERMAQEASNTVPQAQFTMVATGIGTNGETCAMHVTGFQPYFYIRLPPVNITDQRITALLTVFEEWLMDSSKQRMRNELAIRDCRVEQYKTYYGYQWDTDQPFLKVVFHSDRSRKKLAQLLERGCILPPSVFPDLVQSPATPYYYFQLFETNCEALIRFFHEQELNPCGWVELAESSYQVYTPSIQDTRAHIEVECKWTRVRPCADSSIGKIMLASFDIEADSSHGDFPVAIKDYTKPANELISLFLDNVQAKKTVTAFKVTSWLKHMFGVSATSQSSGNPGRTPLPLSRAYIAASVSPETIRQVNWHAVAKIIVERMQTALGSDLYEGDIVNVHIPGKASSEKDQVVEIRVRTDVDTDGPDAKDQYHKEYRLKKTKSATTSTSTRTGTSTRPGTSTTPQDNHRWFRLMDADGTKDRRRKCISRENGFRPYHEMTSLEWGRRKKQLHRKLIACMGDMLPPLAGDQVIQIGTVFWRFGEPEPCLKHVITLNTCDPIEGVMVESYQTEAEVLTRWSEVMREMAPNIVTGYNIFGFDYKFMWERADVLGVAGDFGNLSTLKDYITRLPHRMHNDSIAQNQLLPGRKPGDPKQCRCCHYGMRCKLIEKELTSAGLGENRMYYMDVPGMVQIDMLKDIMKDHNLSSYKLDDVASHFIHGNVESIEHVTVEDQTHTQFKSDNAYGILANDYVHLYRMSVIGREPVEQNRKFRVRSVDHQPETGDYLFVLDEHVSSLDLSESSESYVWGLGKDDVSPQDIFRMQKEGSTERAVIAKYCVKDCELVLSLMMKLQTVSNNLGMSRVCSVPFQYIFTRGQGIKTFSLLSRECRARGYRIPYRRSDGLDPSRMSRHDQDVIFKKGFPRQSDEPVDEKETYQGAFVLDPKPGIYLDDAIAVLDYSSLYPSSIISHNLCASSIVLDKAYLGDEGAKKLTAKGLAFKDIEYDNYVSVRRGVTYEKRRNTQNPTTTCRFIQPRRNPKDHSIEDTDRAILPQTLRILLSQRKATRKKIKTEKDPFVCAVLDGLQLAYKVTANSVYGSLGATTNPIFFKDIAAATTATGREMLLFAKRFVMEHFPGSEIVYGDTDSIFINFHPKDANGESMTGQEGLAKSIELGIQAGDMATKELQDEMHLAPQELEYEKTFYPFILLSKKRYAAMKYEFNPKKGKLNYMGIVLKRRDNAPIVKVMYADVLDAIMNAKSIPESVRRLRKDLEQLIAGKYPLDYLVISKSLRSHYDNPDQIVHKVLADRMAERDPGNKPQANDRIPYAYIDVGDRQITLQGERVEHPDFIRANNLRTDATFYITNQISKPIAQIYALVLEQLPGYKHRNDPHYFENLRRKYRDEGRAEDKIRKKIEEVRITMATEILFGRYLREERNRREGSRTILEFFGRAPKGS